MTKVVSKARPANASRPKAHGPQESPLQIGYQWGEPPIGKTSLVVNRIGDDLEILGAMPQYLSDHNAFDLIRQFWASRTKPGIAKRRSPHIAFANATNDEDLWAFVRTYGPVVCTESSLVPLNDELKELNSIEDSLQMVLIARQNLEELKNEQKLYRAALALVAELNKSDRDYDFYAAQQMICQISEGIKHWPRQWRRERKHRGSPLLWKIQPASVKRVTGLASATRDRFIRPQADARIALCELLNAFPSFVFPNPLEMQSYLRYGIRPLLYAILRHEFLQLRDVAICANNQCRAFFEVQRARQRFCDEVCSRQYRQRQYWQQKGRDIRRSRRRSSAGK